MDIHRDAVMKALINEQWKRFVTAGEDERQCFLYNLLEHGKHLKEKQLQMLLWEPIIETSDTTLVTTEWAMYELGKDRVRQELLYNEITRICGSNKVTEDMLSQIPYLTAVFHETLRYHNPVAMVPLRYIAINPYGCYMDKKQRENPDQWLPERFLDPKFDPMDLHKTMAFGGGRRVCAGALQASLIACTALGRFVQLKQEEEEDVDTVGLTTLKLRPLHVARKPRKG
ncbi:Cytochrome P450 [Dillenia turbinata]|uniref:Cytochrome P450 n=1 Tax=Dillenia turbinata TaxID=194707 RepID=A0AAN8VZP5_9MAGN